MSSQNLLSPSPGLTKMIQPKYSSLLMNCTLISNGGQSLQGHHCQRHHRSSSAPTTTNNNLVVQLGPCVIYLRLEVVLMVKIYFTAELKLFVAAPSQLRRFSLNGRVRACMAYYFSFFYPPRYNQTTTPTLNLVYFSIILIICIMSTMLDFRFLGAVDRRATFKFGRHFRAFLHGCRRY